MDTTLPSPPESDLHVKINQLETLVEQLRSDLIEAGYRHHADIGTIGERLIELAEEYGWCATFDREVANLNNGDLNVELPTRRKDFEVTMVVELRIQHVTETELTEQIDAFVNDAERLDNVDMIHQSECEQV